MQQMATEQKLDLDDMLDMVYNMVIVLVDYPEKVWI